MEYVAISLASRTCEDSRSMTSCYYLRILEEGLTNDLRQKSDFCRLQREILPPLVTFSRDMSPFLQDYLRMLCVLPSPANTLVPANKLIVSVVHFILVIVRLKQRLFKDLGRLGDT
jgi:hypothetical protein